MAKYFICWSILFGCFTDQVFGQQLPPIQLDRPDQTECPFITPKNYIQLESGWMIQKENSNTQTSKYPSTLWKYGINDKFELRLIAEYVSQSSNGQKINGIKPITIGFKTALVEEKGILPKISFIGHLTSSTLGSKPFHSNYLAPSFRFTIQHTLSEKATLAYNLGAEWDGENAGETYLYTLTTGYGLTQKLSCYAEVFGYFPKFEKAQHSIDGGFTYLINNNLMVDVSGCLGITATAPQNYIAFGISYRFKVK